VRYAGKYLRYNAELPEEAGEDKYDAEARSIISLLKYGSIMAFSLSSSGNLPGNSALYLAF